MTLQEVEFVKESLEQISLEELQGINSYIILRESDNVIKSEIKLLTDLLKNSFILVITIIASYKILPKKILVEFFLNKDILEVLILTLLYLIIMFMYLRPTYLDFTYTRKRVEIANIFPKILFEVIQEKEKNVRSCD